MSEGNRKAKKSYLILGVVVVLALAGYFGYGILFGAQETTDDAQLEADVVPLSSRVSAPVLHVAVQDNQEVKAGDLILELDPTDFAIKVQQAEADYEAALAQAETVSSKPSKEMTAQVQVARAALLRAQTELKKAEADLKRALQLKNQNAISIVELETYQNTYDKDKAAVEQSDAQFKVAQSQHSVAQARVKAAESALNQAQTQLKYTKIFAPSAGILSNLAVREGQWVQAGQLLVQLVSKQTYVVANFKETQVGRMKLNQKTHIKVDSFPGRVFEGTVESISPATGARFSIVPPDNASGNFVKVVQRVPVKIRLSDDASAGAGLRAGLSADATVFLK